MEDHYNSQLLFNELKVRFPEVPDQKISSLMVESHYDRGKCFLALGQESNKYLYGEQTAERQRSSSGGSCASGRDTRVRNDSVESGSSAGSISTSGATIPRPVFYSNSNFITGNTGNYLGNPVPYYQKQTSAPTSNYSYNHSIYPPSAHISLSSSTGNLPESGAASGHVQRVHTVPELSKGYAYPNQYRPQGQNPSIVLGNTSHQPQHGSQPTYLTSQQGQFPSQYPQFAPPCSSGDYYPHYEVNTTRPTPSRPGQFNQGFPPGAYSGIAHNAVSPHHYQPDVRVDQNFKSPTTNQVNIYPQLNTVTPPQTGKYSSSVYINMKNSQSPTHAGNQQIPKLDLLASTDPEIHKIVQQPIQPVPSPASSHSSSKDFLNQNDTRGELSQSPGSDDSAYIQALLLHQKARKEKLEEDLNQRLEELEKLRSEVQNMESRLLEGRKIQNAIVSAEEIQNVRDTNRKMQIDIQIMTREIDMVNNGTMPLGIIEATEFQNFHQNIGTGQRGSIHGSRNSSSGSETSTRSKPPKPPRPPPPQPPNVPAYTNWYPSHNPQPTYVPRTEPEPFGEPDEGNQWSCKACTFKNHPALDKCEFCEMPKVSLGYDEVDTAR